MTDPVDCQMPGGLGISGFVVRTCPGSSWLGAFLPGPDAARGPREPLAPEETAELARRVRESVSGQGMEISVFLRRGGSLKIVPSDLSGGDEAVALRLARIANAVRACGLSTWWTGHGINVGAGPSSPVPSGAEARQFLTSRLGSGAAVTAEMIEIAQAVLPSGTVPP